jgi:hypothetical protein
MTEFSKNDVEIIVAVNVLSDQTRRVEARLEEIETKLDANSDRLARLETAHTHSSSNMARWAGWAAAVGVLLIEAVLRFIVK